MMRGVVALGITVIIAMLCLGAGGGQWSMPGLADPVVMHLRLPRVLAALLAGSALASAGSALQALFGNRLADPGLLGTSSGAALGVILMLALGLGGLLLPLAAFGGGLAATLLVLGVNRWLKGGLTGLLILGIVISAFCGAAVSLVLFLSDDLALRSAMTWLSGSLSDARAELLPGAAVILLGGLALLWWSARDLDTLSLGDDTARTLGVAVHRTRLATSISAAMLTGAAVSISGIIGFVGMMVPNAVNLLCGGSRRRQLLISALGGALFLLLADTLAREIRYPVDLPAGLVAGFSGPPFFLWLFLRQRRRAHD